MADNFQKLLTGLEVFSQGVRQLTVQRALSQANETVQQIRQSEAEDMEKTEAIRQVANNLTLDLLGQGVPVNRIQTAASAIAPGPSEFQQRSQLLEQQQAGQRELEQLRQQNILLRQQQEREFEQQQAERQREFRREERVSTQAFESREARRQRQFQEREGGKNRELKENLASQALQNKIQDNLLKLTEKQSKENRERMVPGFGLANTKEDAKEVKVLVSKLKPAQQSIDKLIKLFDSPTTSALSPTARRKAQVLAGTLRGQLRLLLIGPGSVSDQEREVLEDIIARPEIFQFSGAAAESLKELKNSLSRELQTALEVRGVIPVSQEEAQLGQRNIPGLSPRGAPPVPVDTTQGARNFLKPVGK